MMKNTLFVLLIAGMVWGVGLSLFGVWVLNIWRPHERRPADWTVASLFMSGGLIAFALCLWKFVVVLQRL